MSPANCSLWLGDILGVDINAEGSARKVLLHCSLNSGTGFVDIKHRKGKVDGPHAASRSAKLSDILSFKFVDYGIATCHDFRVGPLIVDRDFDKYARHVQAP